MKESPYLYLLKDSSFKRWYDNVARGSIITATVWLRRVGMIHARFGKTPQQLAKMNPKQASNFLMDIVTTMQKQGKRGGYISSCIKPLKNWFEYNDIKIAQRIKIKGQDDTPTLADERTPTPDELRAILHAGDLRAKTASAIISFSGVRLEVLGDYLGNDGLKIKDFPEVTIKGDRVNFRETPTLITIRSTLSKTGKQFFTFLCDEGCDYLKQYLEWRLRRNEKLTPESPIITPTHAHLAGAHIRTTNISDFIRKAIRDAGFTWRPYVLRRYFDTRLMMAESDGLIIRDYRTFWMGHSGDIEHTYTLNKGLSKDVLEKMRESYSKAASKCLITARKDSTNQDAVIERFNRQFLTMAGYSEEDITQLGELSKLSAKDVQDLIQKKSMRTLGLNGNGRQKVVPLNDVRTWVIEGWEYVSTLPTNEAIVRLPSP
jgi:integrase